MEKNFKIPTPKCKIGFLGLFVKKSAVRNVNVYFMFKMQS